MAALEAALAAILGLNPAQATEQDISAKLNQIVEQTIKKDQIPINDFYTFKGKDGNTYKIGFLESGFMPIATSVLSNEGENKGTFIVDNIGDGTMVQILKEKKYILAMDEDLFKYFCKVPVALIESFKKFCKDPEMISNGFYGEFEFKKKLGGTPLPVMQNAGKLKGNLDFLGNYANDVLRKAGIQKYLPQKIPQRR